MDVLEMQSFIFKPYMVHGWAVKALNSQFVYVCLLVIVIIIPYLYTCKLGTASGCFCNEVDFGRFTHAIIDCY